MVILIPVRHEKNYSVWKDAKSCKQLLHLESENLIFCNKQAGIQNSTTNDEDDSPKLFYFFTENGLVIDIILSLWGRQINYNIDMFLNIESTQMINKPKLHEK